MQNADAGWGGCSGTSIRGGDDSIWRRHFGEAVGGIDAAVIPNVVRAARTRRGARYSPIAAFAPRIASIANAMC
jgi:hypothetical protein